MAFEAHGIAVLHRQARPTLLRSELGLPSLNHAAREITSAQPMVEAGSKSKQAVRDVCPERLVCFVYVNCACSAALRFPPPPKPRGEAFWVDPRGLAERAYRFRKSDSGRLWSRKSSAVIIIPGISATTAIGGTIRPWSGLSHLYLPPTKGSGFGSGLNPRGPAERAYRFPKKRSGRLKIFHRKTRIESIGWSRISSSVIIIPGNSATTAIGGTIRPRSGFQVCKAVPYSLSRILTL